MISAAIIADGGGRIDKHMRRQVSALHARVESGGRCRLDVSLCRDAPGMTARDGLYPVNSLRNVALRAARTDLVLSLVSGARSATSCKRFSLVYSVVIAATHFHESRRRFVAEFVFRSRARSPLCVPRSNA